MATFWRSNQVDPASTESNINIGSSGKGGEKKDDTVRVGDGFQADSEIDSKDTIEPKQKKKKKKSKKKKTQETSEKQAALAQDEQEQGQATQQSEEKDSVLVAKSAKKCIFIPETRIVMYSNEASCLLDDWSQLVASKRMDKTKSKFEIEVINMGKTDQIVMGFFFDCIGSAPPGWCDDSAGYHLNNGSIYSGEILEATKTNVTPAKKGDKITLEIRSGRTEGHESDEKYFHLTINNNDIISGLEIPGLEVYSDVYPCIAMSSKGAAVKLLNDTFWMVNKTSDNSDDNTTPTMSTVEKDGIMISPKEAISMSERSSCVYGLMSISNTSPNKQSIAFEVRYGKSDTR